MAIHETHQWQGADGKAVFGQIWQPEADTKVRAVICLVHGLGEHSSRYKHFAQFMGQKGIAVVAADLRGHGQSEGRRGDVAAFSVFYDQIDQLLAEADRRFSGLPRFIYGHSLGGNIVTNYTLLRRPRVNGVIVSAPWLRTPQPVPAAKMQLAKMMRYIYGGYREDNGLNVGQLARVPAVVEAYKNDPLVHRQISVRLFWEGYNAGQYALAHAQDLQLPMLLMHGTADGMTDHLASREFAAQNPRFVTYKEWEGFYHELHNEAEQNEVMQTVVGWIEKRL